MALSVGATAPDFSLISKTSEGLVTVTLSEALKNGAVALLFVPAAFTGVCTTEFCDMSGGLGDFADMGVQVFGVSPDSPFAQAEWAAKNGFGVQLLSDYQRQVTRDYDVVWPNFVGLGPGTARAVFLIGQDGLIKHAELVASLGEMPDLDALKAAAKGL